MILADKIIENRKKNGWSQEDLAERLGVSRQSVSKWESAQAVPDLKKILQLADLFSVSTDYLLKDEFDVPAPSELVSADTGDILEESRRSVSVEEANEFLKYNERAAGMVSSGVMITILSPVLMILLAGHADAGFLSMDEDTAGILGLVILLLMIAGAVALFLKCGIWGKKYDYLEELNIETQYGVSGLVKELRANYEETHSRRLIVGIMLCIVSVIPLVLSQVIRSSSSDAAAVIGICVLLILCAFGVRLIVQTCMIHGGFEKLLEEGDYTRMNKKTGKYDGIYWAIVTAGYLAWSFATMRWDFTWLVWPVAGVLFAAYREIMKAVIRRR